MKLSYLITLMCVIIFTCRCGQDENYLVRAESAIEDIYSSKFSTFSGEEQQVDPIELYKKIEEYYLFLNLLESPNKKGYLNFYNTYIQNDSIIKFDCLYQSHPFTESLILPVNLAHNFYAFEQGINEYAEKINQESQLVKAYDALLKMKSGMNLAFDNRELFSNYINVIEDDDFEMKVIYRLPIIAFSHVVLSEREQFKKNRERRKNKEK